MTKNPGNLTPRFHRPELRQAIPPLQRWCLHCVLWEWCAPGITGPDQHVVSHQTISRHVRSHPGLHTSNHRVISPDDITLQRWCLHCVLWEWCAPGTTGRTNTWFHRTISCHETSQVRTNTWFHTIRFHATRAHLKPTRGFTPYDFMPRIPGVILTRGF